MSERLTNILGYLTLFAILGAIWVLFGEDPAREQGGRGEPTFDGMKNHINEVTTLVFTREDKGVRLRLAGDAWTVAERTGYPADTDKVRTFLRGVALSTRREPKTANPDRFARIGLGAEALRVSLGTREDEERLVFDMGKQSMVGTDRSLTYVFQETDTRTWLVTALGEASSDPAWWLDSSLLEIEPDRVKAVRLGDVTLSRKLGEANFSPENLGEEEEAAPSWHLGEPGRILARLSFADVRHLGNPLSDPKTRVRLVTHDGLVVTLELYDMEGAIWAQVAAAFDATARDVGEAGTLKDAPANGMAEAEAINEHARGWFFKLSHADSDVLTQSRAAFVKAKQKTNDATP